MSVDCDRLVHRGLGLGRVHGLVVFVFGALPGEAVTARVTRVYARHAFADTVEVRRASPDRVTPVCPVFGSCGGCQLQHASYSLQLQVKLGILQEALERRGLALPAATDVAPSSQQWGYRWRGELHLDAAGTGLGFKARDGYQVVTVSACPIHHPAINAVLPTLPAALAFAPKRVQTVHLTVGDDGDEVLLQTRPDRGVGTAAEADRLFAGHAHPGITTEATSLTYRDRKLRVFPDSFIQVNQGSLESLYETVVDWLSPVLQGASVVDAYGGSGALSLRLADLGAEVTVIEANPVSARLCQLHGEMYCPGRLTVRCGPVEDELPRISEPTVVVLDPPRSGLSPQVAGWLCLVGPATIAYLSCEVSALARDLEALCRMGPYRLDRVRLVDMFPQTYHFEVVVLLQRT